MTDLSTISVNGWPTSEQHATDRFEFDPSDEDGRLTHQLFRFPAKIHPPVVRRLLADYTRLGDRVVDPFTGSGTVQVEASIADRHSVGFDVDPLAVFLAHTKSQPIDLDELHLAAGRLLERCDELRRPAGEYEQRMHQDLDPDEYAEQVQGLDVPAIPRLEHWFRRYVVVDLARLRDAIACLDCSPGTQALLLLVFASAIRGSSNADPVPVSGLERTSHMLRRDEQGRRVDPYGIFARKLRRAFADIAAYHAVRSTGAQSRAVWADATDPLPLARGETVDAIITSPPYHGAVDYYRRHQLEMFWLGHTTTQADRLALLDRYIGRPHVPQRHRFVLNTDLALWPGAAAVEQEIRAVSGRRADEFRHYCVAMARALKAMADVLPDGAPAVLIVGHSRWNGQELKTSDLIAELASPRMELDQLLWYPVRNRHMSYGRHNGANIDREYVLVLRRVGSPKE